MRSGLFSLAAHRLGARVRSFDYDADSVAAAPGAAAVRPPRATGPIEHGSSSTSRPWPRPLGRFDVVYSWGVLHHTGDLWGAIDIVFRMVAPGGRLFVSVYNDQGIRSRVWRQVKRRYNALRAVRPLAPCARQLPLPLAAGPAADL